MEPDSKRKDNGNKNFHSRMIMVEAFIGYDLFYTALQILI